MQLQPLISPSEATASHLTQTLPRTPASHQDMICQRPASNIQDTTIMVNDRKCEGGKATDGMAMAREGKVENGEYAHCRFAESRPAADEMTCWSFVMHN